MFGNPILMTFEVETDAKLVECLLRERCPVIRVNGMIWLIQLKEFKPMGKGSDSSLVTCSEGVMCNGLSAVCISLDVRMSQFLNGLLVHAMDVGRILTIHVMETLFDGRISWLAPHGVDNVLNHGCLLSEC